MFDSSNPVLSPDGKNVVCGFGDLSLNYEPLMLRGTQLRGTFPGWFTNNDIAFLDKPDEEGGSRICVYRGPDVEPTVLFNTPFNKAAYGGGRWIGTNSSELRTYVSYLDGPVRTFDDTSSGVMSPDGTTWACVEGNNTTNRGLIVNGQVVLRGKIHDSLSIVGNAVVFSLYESPDGGVEVPQTYGYIDGRVEKLGATWDRYEMDPVVVRTPGGLWVISHDNTRTLIRPWASKFGYARRNTKTPHAIFVIDDGTLRLVGDAEGNLLDSRVVLTDPRIDLSKKPDVEEPPLPLSLAITMTPNSAEGVEPLEFTATVTVTQGGPAVRCEWESSKDGGNTWKSHRDPTIGLSAKLKFPKPGVYLFRAKAFDSNAKFAITNKLRAATVTPKQEEVVSISDKPYLGENKAGNNKPADPGWQIKERIQKLFGDAGRPNPNWEAFFWFLRTAHHYYTSDKTWEQAWAKVEPELRDTLGLGGIENPQ